MDWNISPACEVDGVPAYLTDNSSGNYGSPSNPTTNPPVTIYTPINEDGTLADVQLWSPVYIWYQGTNNFVLRNVGTGNLIQFNTNSPGNISLVEDRCGQETDTVGSSPVLNCGGVWSATYTAIRPKFQTGNYNLNVYGANGIVNGREVQFFHEDPYPATSNEIWTFLCGNIPPSS